MPCECIDDVEGHAEPFVDLCGFPVPPAYRSLYEEFLPVWTAEERERRERWAVWLKESFEEVRGGQEASPDDPADHLEEMIGQALSLRHGGTAEASKETLQQLRALVQMGCPREHRALCWRLFLDLDLCVKREGSYEVLVEQALAAEREFGGDDDKSIVTQRQRPGEEDPEDPQDVSTVGRDSDRAVDRVSTEEISRLASNHNTYSFTLGTEYFKENLMNESGSEQELSCPGRQRTPTDDTGPSPLNHVAVPRHKIEEEFSETVAEQPETSAGCVTACADTAKERRSAPHPALDPAEILEWLYQIDKDLHRTFPGHPSMTEERIDSLRRVLVAYACRNPAVGYCQGLNFLAATFLLFFTEEYAFWALSRVVEELLPGYFDARMVAVQVDGLAFEHLLHGSCPRVAEHLDALQVDIPSATSAWFLVAFVNSLPSESMLRIWDLFFFERSPVVLFRAALALIDIYSQALLETIETGDAYALLQAMAPMTCDASALVDTASIAWGHINDAALWVLRDRHRPEVLEAMKGAFSCDSELESVYSLALSHRPLSRSQSLAEALFVGAPISTPIAAHGSRPLTPGGSLRRGAAMPSLSPLILSSQRSISPAPKSPFSTIRSPRKEAFNRHRAATPTVQEHREDDGRAADEGDRSRDQNGVDHGDSVAASQAQHVALLHTLPWTKLPEEISLEEACSSSSTSPKKGHLHGIQESYATRPTDTKSPHDLSEKTPTSPHSVTDATSMAVNADCRSPWPLLPPRRTLSSAVPLPSSWHHLSQHHVQNCIDLYSFFQRVPDMHRPAVAAAFRIASNASRKKQVSSRSRDQNAASNSSKAKDDDASSFVHHQNGEELYSRTPVSLLWKRQEEENHTLADSNNKGDTDVSARSRTDRLERTVRTETSEMDRDSKISSPASRTIDVSTLAQTVKALHFDKENSPSRPVPRRFTDGGALVKPSREFFRSEWTTNSMWGYGGQESVQVHPPVAQTSSPKSPGTIEQKMEQLNRVLRELEEAVERSVEKRDEAAREVGEAKETAEALRGQVAKLQSEVDVKTESLRSALESVRKLEEQIAMTEIETVSCQATSAELEAQLEALQDRTASQDTMVRRLMDALDRFFHQ